MTPINTMPKDGKNSPACYLETVLTKINALIVKI